MAKRWYYKDENGNKVPVPQYKINSDNHYTKSDADNKFATKESTDTKVAKTDIVQSVGNATDKIMSQKASTDSFIANTPSGDPMHNLYIEVGAIYNDTGKDIERVDQWGDTIIHKDGCWYLNGLGDLTNADMNRCWVYGNCIYHGYNFTISAYGGYDLRTNIPYVSKGKAPTGNVYKDLTITNWRIDTFAFNDITFKDISKVSNNPLSLGIYAMFNTNTIKFYGWIVCDNAYKDTFHSNDKTECIGLILTGSAYINLKKLRADCIRQIISAVRATKNITITLHPEAYDRAIADAGVQEALANKTNVSLAKGE